MPNLIDIDDFVAEYQLSTDMYEGESLYDFIEDKQLTLLTDLLGVELADLLINDISTIPPYEPQTPIYQDIFNSFRKDIEHHGFIYWDCFSGFDCLQDFFCHSKAYYESKGIPFYLKAMIFYEYVREFVGQTGISSVGQLEDTNKSNINMTGAWLANKYNNGIDTGRAIQWYIRENSDDYPEFNGSKLDYTLPL